MAVFLHEEDLPDDVLGGTGPIAIDTETMGLQTLRDRLCLVQISDGNGDEHLVAAPLFCTKIASRLTRTFTDRHGLKELVKELLSTDISKQQQSSDWGGPVLSEAQKDYAASDVRYLHRLHAEFVGRLEREGRTEIAQACFDFLPHRARLALMGWPETDIFAHA